MTPNITRRGSPKKLFAAAQFPPYETLPAEAIRAAVDEANVSFAVVP